LQLLLKSASVALALVAAFVPLSSSATTTLLTVERSGGVPGFQSAGQLHRYLAFNMAEAQPGHWRFEPAAAGDAPAPDRVEWRFKLQPYAGGEVRSFVPADMADETFGVHRPITIEARLYLKRKYRRLVKGTEIIQGGPHDPDLAAAVARLTQNLLSPAGADRAVNNSQHQASRRDSASRAIRP
jgi:hypothetical protein